jgi:hypothetical protein
MISQYQTKHLRPTYSTLQRKSHLCIPFLGIARPQSQFPHSCVCEQFVYSQDLSTYFPAAEYADRSWKYKNLAQIYECRNWETEHYNSVLEITVSFLGILKWEPDIYIGFSPVPEFIDPVFTKTSPKRWFSLNRKRAFWLVFAKTGSIISGTAIYLQCSAFRQNISNGVMNLQ